MSDDDTFRIRPIGLFGQGQALVGTPQRDLRDLRSERQRETTIKQVDGGYIVTLTGGGFTYEQRVASNEDQLIAMIRGFLSGTLASKETP